MGLIARTDYFACWFHSPSLHSHHTHVQTDPFSATPEGTSSPGEGRSQPGHGRRGEAARTTPSGGAAQPDEAGVRRVRGRAPDGAPLPAGQPAGSPALSRKALCRRACSGAAPGRAQGHSPSFDEKGAHRKEPLQIHTYRRTAAWQEGTGRQDGRTTQLTCQPSIRLLIQEANPERFSAALPERRRGDKDETPPRPR